MTLKSEHRRQLASIGFLYAVYLGGGQAQTLDVLAFLDDDGKLLA